MAAAAPKAHESTSGVSALKFALNDCNRSWHVYLHMLNDLCSAGTQLAETLAALEKFATPSGGFGEELPMQATLLLKNAWKNLARATQEATVVVKANIECLLQEYIVYGNNMEEVRNHNNLVVMETAQALLKVQQKFCFATQRVFMALSCCIACQTPVGDAHADSCNMADELNLIQRKATDIIRTRIWGPFPSGVILDPEPHLNYENECCQELCSLRAIFEQTKGLTPMHRQAVTPQQFSELRAKPFYREAMCSADFPTFPLNGQAAQQKSTEYKNIVTWDHTKLMPKICFKNSDADDGLQSAVQLLSISPIKKNNKLVQNYPLRLLRKLKKMRY